MIVQIAESDFLRVFGRLYFGKVEVDGVVVRQVDQQRGESLIFKNGRQELVGFGELGHEFGPKLGPGNGVEVVDVDEGSSLVQEHLSAAHQAQCVFEGHLDIVFGLGNSLGQFERNLVFVLQPDFV